MCRSPLSPAQAFAVAPKPSSQQQLLDVAGKLVQRPADDITLRIWPFLCPMGKLSTACSDRAIAITRSLANVWHVPDECDDKHPNPLTEMLETGRAGLGHFRP